jgi:hypothetical protein
MAEAKRKVWGKHLCFTVDDIDHHCNNIQAGGGTVFAVLPWQTNILAVIVWFKEE